MGLHPGIGIEFIVQPTAANGVLVDGGATLRQEGRSPDICLSDLFTTILTL